MCSAGVFGSGEAGRVALMKMLTEQQLLSLLRKAYTMGWRNGHLDTIGQSEPVNLDAELAKLVHADAGGYDSKGKQING